MDKTAEEYIIREYGKPWLNSEWQPEDVIDALNEFGKNQWNESIDTVIENAELTFDWSEGYIINKRSILKLKKK